MLLLLSVTFGLESGVKTFAAGMRLSWATEVPGAAEPPRPLICIAGLTLVI